jgi:predicted Zn-dependent peptidase
LTPADPQPFEKTTLSNGIRLITRRIPQIRSVSLGIWVSVGARDEIASENGLSHFIEHMVFKGTQRRTAFQIAREFDASGGYTNAFTSMESTCYHAKVLDTHLHTMVDILSDIFLNSLFDAEEVERERTVILQEIGMVEDNPDDYIHHLSGRNFWGDNPLGRSILGKPENVLGFDTDTIRSFFHRLYQPERIVISAAGNLEHDHLVALLAPAFETIRPGNGFPERHTPGGRFDAGIHTKDLEQAHLCMLTQGYAITAPQRFALSLLNTILGGNMSSRLFQEVRERRGLAYSVYSFINAYVDTGIYGIYAGVAPQNIAQTVAVVLEQLDRLRKDPVSDTELQAAKEFSKGNLLLASESNDNQMVRLAQNDINFGRYVPLQEVVDQIEQVQKEEIRELALDLFRPGRIALTLLGPDPKNDDALAHLKSWS